jgi:hypothetical protein
MKREWKSRAVRRIAAGCLAVALAVTGSALAPAFAGQNEMATVSLSIDGHKAVRFAERTVVGQGLAAGEEFDVTVVLEGTGTVRAVDMPVQYDPEAFEFVEWNRDPQLMRAVEVGPHNHAPSGTLSLMIAFLDPYVPGVDKDFSLGTIRFKSLGKPGAMSVPYLELVDQDFQMDARGAKPVIYMGRPEGEVAPEKHDLGDGFWWSDAYPNPFDTYTHIDFNLPDTAFVSIDVVDGSGHVVRPLISSVLEGTYTTVWVGKDIGGDPVDRGDYQAVIKVRGKEAKQDLHFVPEGALEDTSETQE